MLRALRPALGIAILSVYLSMYRQFFFSQRYKDAAYVALRRTHEHFTRPSLPIDDLEGYQKRVEATLHKFEAVASGREQLTLKIGAFQHAWGTQEVSGAKLDLSHYVHVLAVDEEAQTVDVEGRAYFTDVLTYLWENHRMTLTVIPDMVHLTVGGLYGGAGGGAASFRYGALHHSVLEVDLLNSAGKLVTCSPTANADLFALLPGSLGTFGYVLRMKLQIKKAGRYVVAKHTLLDGSAALMSAFQTHMSTEPLADFLDGVIYSANESVLIEGRMVDTKPAGQQIYSLSATGIPYAFLAKDGGEHWFELIPFIYKWDADGYFSTWEHPGWAWNPSVRMWLATLFPWYHRSDWLRELFSILWGFDLKKPGSHMYVDYLVPLGGAAENLEWYDKEVGVYPLYMAPIGLTSSPIQKYTLWNPPLPGVDIGVGYGPMGNIHGKRNVLRTRKKMEQYFGKVEGGTRLLSTNIDLNNVDQFWSLFPEGAQDAYFAAKVTYDTEKLFPDLVQKLSGNIIGVHDELAMRNVMTGGFINVWGGDPADGAVIGSWPEDDDQSLWIIENTTGEASSIRSVVTGKYLCVKPESANVTQCSDRHAAKSRWKLDKTPGGALTIQSLLNMRYVSFTRGEELVITSAVASEGSMWELVEFEF